MRCLHCAKELPLLKRLTGGEFCSDEHRQAYQREYSQMALSRLLQAKPPIGEEGAQGAGHGQSAEKEAGQELALVKRGAAGKKRSEGPLSLGLSGRGSEGRTGEVSQDAKSDRNGESKSSEARQTESRHTEARQLEAPARSAKEKPARFAVPTEPVPAAKTEKEPGARDQQGLRDFAGEEKAPALEQPLTAAPVRASEPPRLDAPLNSFAPKELKAKDTQVEAKEAMAPAPLGDIVPELPKRVDLHARPPREILPKAETFAGDRGMPAANLTLDPRSLMQAEQVALSAGEGRIAPATAAFQEAETELVDFTRTAQIVSWQVAVESAFAPARVTGRASVPAQLSPVSRSSKIWYLPECSLQPGEPSLGALTRLDFPIGELEHVAARRNDTAPANPKTASEAARALPAAVEADEMSADEAPPEVQDMEGLAELQAIAGPSVPPSFPADPVDPVEVASAADVVLAPPAREDPEPALSAVAAEPKFQANSGTNGNGMFRKPTVIKLVRPVQLRPPAPAPVEAPAGEELRRAE